MILKTPEKVGEPRVIVEPKWGKGMIEQDYLFPDGSTKTFNLWHSPGARTSIMFPLTPDGKVILLRQWRPAAAVSAPDECVVTELPGGNAKKGTAPTPEEVADAELAEETGYDAREWRLTSPKQIWWEPANLTPRYSPVVGLGCEWVSEPKHDETELMEIIVVPLAELIEMIRRGEVCDNKSIAGTFLALLRLGMIELKLP